MSFVTPEFRKRLHRAQRLFLRELRDGCVECLSQPGDGYCRGHYRTAGRVLIDPRKVPEFQEFFRGFK